MEKADDRRYRLDGRRQSAGNPALKSSVVPYQPDWSIDDESFSGNFLEGFAFSAE